VQGAIFVLGLACGGVKDARELLQRLLGMTTYHVSVFEGMQR
jgi:hypothetical protein